MKWKLLPLLIALPFVATPAMAQYYGPRPYQGQYYMQGPVAARPEMAKSPYCKIKSQAWRDSWEQYYHCWGG